MIRAIAICLAITALPIPSHAQDQVELDGEAIIGAGTINVASGIHNQQANIGVIALGDVAASNAFVAQHGQQAIGSTQTSVSLAPGAFAGSSGWLALSASAGNANQHANIAIFAFGSGASLASDSRLSQARAPIEPAGGPIAPTASQDRSVAIGDAALAGSRGLVQVSLVGGDANTSANSFALTYDPGAISTGN